MNRQTRTGGARSDDFHRADGHPSDLSIVEYDFDPGAGALIDSYASAFVDLEQSEVIVFSGRRTNGNGLDDHHTAICATDPQFPNGECHPEKDEYGKPGEHGPPPHPHQTLRTAE